jgi:hypothetical protein
MALGTKYTLDYLDLANDKWSIIIKVEGYSGASSKLVGTGNPLSWEALTDQDDPFGILGRQVTVNIRNTESLLQYVSLATDAEKEVQVVINKNDSHYFTGFLTPLNYVQDYKVKGTVSLTFTDRLGALRNEPFVDGSGVPYTGTATLMQIIADILALTGISLDIYSYDNMFASGMDKTAADDPLVQSKIYRQYYAAADGEPSMCYDVLSAILATKNLSLRQHPEGWVLFNPADLTAATVPFRRFNSVGVYQANGTTDWRTTFVKDWNQPNAHDWWANNRNIKRNGSALEFVYPMGIHQIAHTYEGFLPNALNNDFELDKWSSATALTGVTTTDALTITRRVGGIGGQHFMQIDSKSGSLGSAKSVAFPAVPVQVNQFSSLSILFDANLKDPSIPTIGLARAYVEIKLVGTDTHYWVQGLWSTTAGY